MHQVDLERENRRLKVQIEHLKRLVDSYGFCPDCRDKMLFEKECPRCKFQRLERENERLKKHIEVVCVSESDKRTKMAQDYVKTHNYLVGEIERLRDEISTIRQYASDIPPSK